LVRKKGFISIYTKPLLHCGRRSWKYITFSAFYSSSNDTLKLPCPITCTDLVAYDPVCLANNFETDFKPEMYWYPAKWRESKFKLHKVKYGGGKNATSLLVVIKKQHVSAYSEAIFRFTNC
jgi:hypothetical protein